MYKRGHLEYKYKIEDKKYTSCVKKRKVEANKEQEAKADEVEAIMDSIDNEKPVDAVPGHLCN